MKIGTYQTDIDEANRLLQAMHIRCVYRLNDVCQKGCPAQNYCLPEMNGLKVVDRLEMEDWFES